MHGIQDKYILGLMVMLCAVCVWHAMVGAAATHVTTDKSPDVTSWPEMTSQETTNVSVESTAVCWATLEMANIQMSDKMALVMFGSLYLLFHVLFALRITTTVSASIHCCVSYTVK